MSLYPMGAFPHLHHPCDRCGYPRRYKQFPLVCKCTTPDRCPHPPIDVIERFCRRCGTDQNCGAERQSIRAELAAAPLAEPDGGVQTPPIPRRTVRPRRYVSRRGMR